MKDRLDTKASQNRPQPGAIAHRPQYGNQFTGTTPSLRQRPQLPLDRIQRVLVVIVEHQGAHTLGDCHAAKGCADRAAGTGDHDHAIAKAARHQFRDRRYGIPPEQVTDIHVPQLGDTGHARQKFLRVGHGLHMNRVGLEEAEDPSTRTTARGRNREQDTAHGKQFEQIGNARRVVDLDTVDQAPMQGGVLVHIRDGMETSGNTKA